MAACEIRAFTVWFPTMEAHLMEWLNLVARWIHVIAGIMWVGNSMLFNWLDRNLRTGNAGEPAKFGESWLLHSGGFYRVEKFRAQASTLPPLLHWFKWQSYTTWISGVALLIIVYFSGRGAFLLDPVKSDLSYAEGVALALSILAGGWLVYDVMWRMPARKPTAQGLVSLALLVLVTWFVHDQFSGRGAYLLMGALLGTLMAGNVFFHIIPSQKQMVAAIEAGQDQDLALADRAKQRSIHNNYMTFPVIFTMISNHFGGLYGHPMNWVILLILFFASALTRHFMNIRFTWTPWRPAIAATLAAAAAALVLVYSTGAQPAASGARELPADPVADAAPVSFDDVWTIVQGRCLSCHSASPTDPVFAAATGGVHFDHPSQLKQYADRIKVRTVIQQTMPLANKTGITPQERRLLGRWVDAGAPLE
jgi:uncharacterized membrane protein